MDEKMDGKKMDMKKMLPIVIGAVVIFGGGFFGGMKYAQAKSASARTARTGQFGAGGSGGQFQAGMGGGRAGGPGGRGMSAGFASGEILSNDGKTLTLKLASGGSKIVFLSDATEVSKFTAGAATDLEVGKTVMVTGKPNDDGSVTAQSVQVRPDGMAFPGGGYRGGAPASGTAPTAPAQP